MKSILLAFAVLAGLIGIAQAQSSSDGSIRITAPWARATAAGATIGGAFLTISNAGGSADKLTAVATPVAAMAELHQTKSDNGVATMTPVASLDVMPGQKVALAPGGYHIMLMGLKSQLKEGESFPLTLTFEKAGKIDVMVKIEKAGAMGSGDMSSMNMN